MAIGSENDKMKAEQTTVCRVSACGSWFAAAMRRMPFIVAVMLFCASESGYAASDHTWNGLGGSGNWGTAGNWDNGIAANDNDILHFDGSTQLWTTNNNAGARYLNGLTFNSGAGAFILTNDASSSITMSWTGTGLISNNCSTAAQKICMPIALQLPTIINVVTNGDLTLSGVISGVALTKTGPGTLRLSGSGSSSAGNLTNEEGVIELNKSGGAIAIGMIGGYGNCGIFIGRSAGNPPPSATIRYAANTGPNQLYQGGNNGGLIINRTGVFDINGSTDTVMSVWLYGTNDISGGGVNTSCGRITNSSPSGGKLTVVCSGAYGNGFYFVGGGRIDMGPAGTVDISAVNTATYYYTNGAAIGCSQPAVMSGQFVALGNPSYYTFNIANDPGLTYQMSIPATILFNGTYFCKYGNGTLLLSGTNGALGSICVNDGTLLAGADSLVSVNGAFGNGSASAPILMGTSAGPGIGPAGDIIAVGTYGNVTIGHTITVANTGGTSYRWFLGGYLTNSSSTFSGNITLNLAPVNLMATNGAVVTFSGNISGANNVTNVGPGRVVFSGADKTYSGTTTISGGTLEVNDTIASAATVATNGTLGGVGKINALVTVANGGHLAPGAYASIGRLTNSSLTLASGSFLDIEFSGAPTNDMVEVTTSGGLTINGGIVNLYNAGTTNTWTSTDGTYNLIKYTGAINGNVSNLFVTNQIPGKVYTFGASNNWVTLTVFTPGPGAPAVDNDGGATNLTATSAWLIANLTSTGCLPTTVRMYWDTTDRGTSSTSSWAHVYDFGLKGVGVYSNQATSLSPGTWYFYRAWAANSTGETWASVSSFKTWGPPTIDNDGGAANIQTNSARLRGQLLDTGGQSTEVYVFWGTGDGGTAQGAWSYNKYLGVNGAGAVSTNVTGLSSNTLYYYRFYATNASGAVWADSTTNFTTPASNLRFLTISTSGSGTVDVVSGWFVYGTNVLITATPGFRYNFASWSGDTNGCSFPGAKSISVYIDGPRQIFANFVKMVITNGIVGLNFTGDRKSMASSDSAGAVVAATNWNNLSGGSGLSTSIVNTAGNISGLTVEWSGWGTWGARNSASNGDETMMWGYLDNNASGPFHSAYITVSNITTYAYDVYVYSGAGGPGGYVTTGINGTNTYAYWAMSTYSNSFPRDYVAATNLAGGAVTNGANYMVWSNMMASSFIITHTVFQGVCNGGVAGVQVVPNYTTMPTPPGTIFMIR
jgi:autotransporter-associated beta strand protein